MRYAFSWTAVKAEGPPHAAAYGPDSPVRGSFVGLSVRIPTRLAPETGRFANQSGGPAQVPINR
jgi:hypothetical protein